MPLCRRPSLLLRVWPLLAAVAMGIHLGGYPLFDADEGRNAEVGREMAATNDYIVPHLDGMPYLDKPVAYFAAAAAAMEVLGDTEVAARLPAYLFTLLTALLIGWFVRREWGEEEAWMAAGVFLTMPFAVAFARTVIFDSLLTLCITAAILAFYLAIEENARWNIVAWLAIGFGILTKGPVAIVVPLLVALPYSIIRRKSSTLWSIAGIAGCVLLFAPWVWAVSRQVPDFLRYVLVTETAERLTSGTLKRTGPPWYFIPYLLGGALPWSIAAFFAPAGGTAADGGEKEPPPRLFLLLWIAVPLLFFSLSQSKRPQYILPLIPAVALLVMMVWRDGKRMAATRMAGAVLAVIGAALITAPFVVASGRMRPEVAVAARQVAVPLGLCTAAAAAIALVFARRPHLSLVALSVPVMAIPLLTNPFMVALGERRSAKSVVEQMRQHVRPQTTVISVDVFSGSMAFYLQRPIVVATDDAADLTSNYLIRHYREFAGAPHSNIRTMQWLEHEIDACCAPRIFVLRNDDHTRRTRFESRGMPLIARGAHHVVYASGKQD